MRAHAFQCNACAQVSPVRGFPDDDILTCAHCGQRQGFPDAELRDVLEIAHATVDPELRDFDVFERLEGKATYILYARDNLSILAAPGHPRCARCHAFVQLGTADGVTCAVTCECGPQTHHVPRVLASRLPELRGVFSDETRTDVPRAATARADGPSAYLCARCGGGFAAATIGHSPIVTCTYCMAANRVDVPPGPKADPVWLLVEGASKKRRDHVGTETKLESPPNALGELVAAGPPVVEMFSGKPGWVAQAWTYVFIGVSIFGYYTWNEVAGFVEYRARAAMVQTTWTIDWVDDSREDHEVCFGKAVDPHTGNLQPFRAVRADATYIWAAGEKKPSTEENFADASNGRLTRSATLPCFLNPRSSRVVFNRPVGFSPIPMFLLMLFFFASCAGGVHLVKRGLRAKR